MSSLIFPNCRAISRVGRPFADDVRLAVVLVIRYKSHPGSNPVRWHFA
jgi:hypothetical protein